MSEAALISGVALSPPQVQYLALTKQAHAQLSRDDWSIPGGSLQLSPSPEWREKHQAPGLIATFPVQRFLYQWRPDHREDTALLKQLFTLLTKHHLLSHAALILARPPSIIEDANEALSIFQARVHELFNPKSFNGFCCEQCEKSKWGSLSSQERYRVYWNNRTKVEICPHNELLAPALEQLFTTFPELMFETLGLIAPERTPKSKQRPTRYTLTPYAFLASLGQKLLGFSSVYRIGDHWFTEEAPEERLAKPERRIKADPATKARRESVLFSADAWGYTGRPEALESQQPSNLYPTLGAEPPNGEATKEEPKPARLKKEARQTTAKNKPRPVTAKRAPEKKSIKTPRVTPDQPAVTPWAPSTISLDTRLFLQQIGEENETLDRLLSALKRLAPSLQKNILALPMKKVIDLLFDLEEE